MAAASTSFLLVAPLVASAASAQDEPLLLASLTPTTVEPGGELTYTSIDPCPQPELTSLVWAYGPDGWSTTEGGAQLDQGEVSLPEDASWSATITAPEEPGRYEMVAVCWTDNDDPENPEALPSGRYPAIDFDVIAAETPEPTVPAVPTPEPTVPQPGSPDFQG